jgi:hypothetical protein
MMKKTVTILIILSACTVGVFCGVGVALLVSKVIPNGKPLIDGILFGVLGILTPLIGYKLIRPSFLQIYSDGSTFGKVSIRIYSFFIILGMSPVFLNIAISALFY